jgi:D-alanyl-D-alanine carboxypeptidase/D-alanyl-D-alanine-endopeptidase (penicillin-binding protein 4)
MWGVKAVRLDTGATVYQRDPEGLFVPASAAKLFSTALALARLGPDHAFHTLVVADAKPDSQGRLRGDLTLLGGGDPSLSGRVFPYTKDAEPGDPMGVIEPLAAQVIAAGVRIIDGDVVGDETAWPWDPYPVGWSLEDAIWSYGAPVSALSFNENSQRLRFQAGKNAEDLVQIIVEPRIEHFVIHNQARTSAARLPSRIEIERIPGTRELHVRGMIPAGASAAQVVAVEDPALFAAQALYKALTSRGVSIRGRPASRRRYDGSVPPPSGVELARRTSPPLLEILRVINKVSNNLYAEMVLREVSRVTRQDARRKEAIEELKAFLTELGIRERDLSFEDGSGLSRLTLVTPTSVVRLLEAMWRSSHRGAWISTLPIGGEDGTLGRRLTGAAERGRVAAKTGSLSHASALAGYVKRKDGVMVAFAILANNHSSRSADIRRAIDRTVLTLADAPLGRKK